MDPKEDILLGSQNLLRQVGLGKSIKEKPIVLQVEKTAQQGLRQTQSKASLE